MANLSLERVCKNYGGRVAVGDMSLEVAEGEFIVFLGPSGCGKTTTLRMIAGFVEPSEGKIRIGGEDVTFVPPRKRGIGMVFQDYALFPNMSVHENVLFGLRQKRVNPVTAEKRVGVLLEMVRLNDKRDAYIDELSGGQQQRVAFARALATEPRLLLMDEPLGALDLKLRQAMQIELKRLQREFGITTVLVTHDQQEAMALADRVVIMNDGKIQQVGTARDLYHRPANAFVADFLGSTTLLAASIVSIASNGAWAELQTGVVVPVQAPSGAIPGSQIIISVRPEELRVLSGGNGQQNSGYAQHTTLSGTVDALTFFGDHVSVVVRLADGTTLTVSNSTGTELTVSERVSIVWPGAAICFLANSQMMAPSP